MSCRAGTLPQAWQVLFGYRRDYPATQHRLVEVSTTGQVTILPDDHDALDLCAETHRADRIVADPRQAAR